ncbi:hypothetical protein R3P38DRAFT_3251562 [Favolaschia claudopus]|uniref:Uncharacterized protein n=1 Tax=Favolaschia claudopus TaxID=2862362 RepID=A0AAW0EDJ1_9AGAR
MFPHSFTTRINTNLLHQLFKHKMTSTITPSSLKALECLLLQSPYLQSASQLPPLPSALSPVDAIREESDIGLASPRCVARLSCTPLIPSEQLAPLSFDPQLLVALSRMGSQGAENPTQAAQISPSPPSCATVQQKTSSTQNAWSGSLFAEPSSSVNIPFSIASEGVEVNAIDLFGKGIGLGLGFTSAPTLPSGPRSTDQSTIIPIVQVVAGSLSRPNLRPAATQRQDSSPALPSPSPRVAPPSVAESSQIAITCEIANSPNVETASSSPRTHRPLLSRLHNSAHNVLRSPKFPARALSAIPHLLSRRSSSGHPGGEFQGKSRVASWVSEQQRASVSQKSATTSSSRPAGMSDVMFLAAQSVTEEGRRFRKKAGLDKAPEPMSPSMKRVAQMVREEVALGEEREARSAKFQYKKHSK